MTSKEISKEEEYVHHVGDKRPPERNDNEKNSTSEEQEGNQTKRIK
jgi:hypothetical protein